MVALKDAVFPVSSNSILSAARNVLVMRVADPWYGRTGRQEHGDVCQRTKNHDGVVLGDSALPYHDNLKQQPCNTGDGTARVNTTKMLECGVSQNPSRPHRSTHLQHRCAAESPYQRRPLYAGVSETIKRLKLDAHTFAKQVLTNKYRIRPKISFRMRIEKLKLATAKAPAYLLA